MALRSSLVQLIDIPSDRHCLQYFYLLTADSAVYNSNATPPFSQIIK